MDVISSMCMFLIVTSLETVLHGKPSDNTSSVWMQHIKAVDSFECNQPQKRSFKVAKLLQGQLSSLDIVVPHTTILHRCDSGTGCCKDALKECMVAGIERVELTFCIINPILKTKNFELFTFVNHTLCSCQITVNDIK